MKTSNFVTFIIQGELFNCRCIILTPKNDPFGSKQFQIWCWAPSRVKLASSRKIHANVHVNACMFCIMLCACCAEGHACLNLSLHRPMLLAPHSLVDNALFIDCMSIFFGTFQCSCTIQCKVIQEGPLSSGGCSSCSRTIQCKVTQEGPLSSGGCSSCSRTIHAHLAAALSSARLPRRAHLPVGAALVQYSRTIQCTTPLSSGHATFQ